MKPLRGGIVVAVRVPVRSHNAVYMSTAAIYYAAPERELGDLRHIRSHSGDMQGKKKTTTLRVMKSAPYSFRSINKGSAAFG